MIGVAMGSVGLGRTSAGVAMIGENGSGAGDGGAEVLVREQLASLRELDGLSRALAAGVGEDPGGILETLAARDGLLDEIAERHGAIGAIGDLGSGDVLEQIESLTRTVHERDERTLGAILARRDELLAELNTVGRSREAIRAYGPGQRDRRRFRDDSA